MGWNTRRLASNSYADNCRYERKSIVTQLTKFEIENLVKLHPAMFSEIYPPRFVNNLYLDSVGMKNYVDSVNGLTERVKVRIRWYGDLFGAIEKPVLEIKIKNGLVGRKKTFPLFPFSIEEQLQRDTIFNVLEKSEIPNVFKQYLIPLECSLLNRYRRKYFQSADRKYRITIDSEMMFYEIRARNNTFLNRSIDPMRTVVELKYDPNEDRYAEEILNDFPFRVGKISKYVNGIDRLSVW